jgi:hypothetical protein
MGDILHYIDFHQLQVSAGRRHLKKFAHILPLPPLNGDGYSNKHPSPVVNCFCAHRGVFEGVWALSRKRPSAPWNSCQPLSS